MPASATPATDAPVAPSLGRADPTDTILDVVAEQLGAVGFEGLQLRDVAKAAHVSLRTIYKHFPSRDELVVAAVERWMALNVYRTLPDASPDEPLGDVLVRTIRRLFSPWERNPTMLRVFVQAALLPGGQRLGHQGASTVGPLSEQHFAGYDAEFADDVQMILTNLMRGLISQFAAGLIDVPDIVNQYERAVRRLTDNPGQP